jgi:acyl-CoA thioesterase
VRFTELMGLMSETDGIFRLPIPAEWAQGRTAYGGLTAAICARAATKAFADLPPLRSAQIGFIGPAAGEAQVRADILRRGRSTTFVGVDLDAEAGLAARALLVFGAGRDSVVTHSDMPMPEVAPPDPDKLLPTQPPVPAFLSQFDIHIARGGLPFMGKGEPRCFWWARHRDEAARAGLLPLLAIGDIPPPAISPIIKGPAPVSSVTWQVDMLTDDVATEDGWYLIESSAEWAGEGWSSQRMGIWNRAGRPLVAHRQSVAVFA